MRKEQARKQKKPIYKKWWFWAVIIVLILGLQLGKSSNNAGSTNTPAVQETQKPSFVLSWDQAGEYGKQLTVNPNTEHAYTFYAYTIPSGTYAVTNKDTSGSVQVTLYTGVKKDGEWEELVSDGTEAPIVLFAGETKDLKVKDGEFVKLSDGGKNVAFTLK